MDIKSWILLIGSVLIVAVICHGFWTAYRTRREPLRIDITDDLPNELDDLTLLRGELPNGGSRLNDGVIDPALEAPGHRVRGRRTPEPPPSQRSLELDSPVAENVPAEAEVDVPLLLDTASAPEPLPEPLVEMPEANPVVRGPSPPTRTAPRRAEPAKELPPVEELVVLNVLAKAQPFDGGDLLELFLRNGIKFGDMNIFHRIDPATKASQYSVANVAEPGNFDLRAMDEMSFRGLCLFMQLPGPSQATKVFTDMLTVAEKLARQLDGEVCDEQFNRLTRQSTEHYRQRVAEFTRRHMSKRA